MKAILGLRRNPSFDHRYIIPVLQFRFESTNPCSHQARKLTHRKALPDAASWTVEEGHEVVISAFHRVSRRILGVGASLPSLGPELGGIRAPKSGASVDGPRRQYHGSTLGDWLATDSCISDCNPDGHSNRREKPQDLPTYSVKVGHLFYNV